MKRLALFSALAGCLAPAQRTTALALTATSITILDWHQTRDITNHCAELNPLLGPCGDRFPVDLYFPIALAGTLILGAALGGQWGDAVLAGVTGAELSTVWANWADHQ